jgi:hypothetical protein
MKHIIEKLQELNNQRDALLKQMRNEFEASIKQLFVENENVHGIYMYLSNHEFNDGEQTNFYIGYDDLELRDSEGDEYENDELREKLVELFAATQDIHELMYGEEYGELNLTREEILKK